MQMTRLRRDASCDSIYDKGGKVFLLLFPLFLFFMIHLHPNPYMRLDLDYHFTLNAFMNHGTPDLRPADFDRPWMQELLHTHKDPWYCMRPNEKGTVYGDHFWLWPLICTPVAMLSQAMGKPPLLAHPIMMGALLWGVLLLAWKYVPLDPARKFAFVVAAGFTPILFYMQVLGSEGYCYIMVLASVVPLSRRRYDLAAACVAAASLQNSAIGPFALILAFAYFVTSDRRLKNLFIALFSLCPALAAPLFYMVTFGRPSLFAGVTPLKITDASFSLLMTHMFDLNGGLILFVPMAVILYFVAWGRQLLRLKKGDFFRELFSPDMMALVGVLAIPFATSVWINWNCGYLGAIRYTSFILPLVVWLSVSFSRRVALTSTFFSVLFTTLWLIFGSWLVPYDRLSYLNWSPVAHVVAKYTPRLCTVWSDEVMFERTRGAPYGYRELDGGSRRLPSTMPVFPIILADPQWGPRKILTTADGWRYFQEGMIFQYPEKFEFISNALKNEKPGAPPRYFNMPAFKSAGMMDIKKIAPEEMRYTLSADVAPYPMLETRLSFDLLLTNDSAVPFVSPPRGIDIDHKLSVLIGLSRMQPDTEFQMDESLGLAMHTRVPLLALVAPGETLPIPVQITLPAEGEYLLIAMLGQDDGYFITEEGHNWFRQKITVKTQQQ